MKTTRRRQKGAALLIVLLLAATLSLVAMSSMQQTTLAAARAGNVTARSEALWNAFAVETLALAAVEQFSSDPQQTMSLDASWAREPIEFPLENGVARVFFADATACFNVNSLSAAYGSPESEKATAEFVRLASFLGVGEFDAAAVAEAIGDWIDADTNRRPQGGEDEHYTALPSPYRAGNQAMAAITELRAVKGVTRELYAALKPYLCARSSQQPLPVNINMLADRHAPLLAAMLGNDVTVQMAREIISSRPPGGFLAGGGFAASPFAEKLEKAPAGRILLTSPYLIARAEIVYDRALLEMTSIIEANPQGARVISRRIGAEE